MVRDDMGLLGNGMDGMGRMGDEGLDRLSVLRKMDWVTDWVSEKVTTREAIASKNKINLPLNSWRKQFLCTRFSSKCFEYVKQSGFLK